MKPSPAIRLPAITNGHLALLLSLYALGNVVWSGFTAWADRRAAEAERAAQLREVRGLVLHPQTGIAAQSAELSAIRSQLQNQWSAIEELKKQPKP